MSDKPEKPLVSVFIDAQEVRVPQGTNIVEAAKSIGVEIPHYCYHKHLTVPGNCRMCLTEMGMEMKDKATGQVVLDEQGKPKVQWIPRPQIACATNAAAGQHFRTTTPMVKDSRNSVLEFILTNHPLDCPICDQAGECKLQEYATDYGRGASRFTEEKNVKPKRTKLGPRVMLDDERCILCSRCIRFSKEIVKDDVLGFIDRGSYSTLACFPGMELKNNYSLNTVDICPVGALTSTDFRFKMRVWFLKETPSICTESSVGVNTTVSSREGVIHRITPRENGAVNDTWMSDTGRDIYKIVEAPNRLRAGTPNGGAAILKAHSTSARVALVVSAYMSLEEQFLSTRLVKNMGGVVRVDAVAHLGNGDGLLISADRTPNMRGLFLTGLIKEYPKSTLDGLKADLAAKKIDVVIAIREDILAAGITAEDLKGVTLVAIDSHETATTKIAQVVQPVGTVFERSGSFVNQQWRVQKFVQAVPNLGGLPTDIFQIDQLLQKIGEPPLPAPTPEAVWKYMAVTVSQLKGLSYATLPSTGQIIDGSVWENISWPEGKTLHYEPRTVAAAAQG